MKCFIREYPKFRDAESCLKWYTRSSFFNKVINKGLRILNRPEEVSFLRLPFSDLFLSIKEMYEKQKNEKFREKNVVIEQLPFDILKCCSKYRPKIIQEIWQGKIKNGTTNSKYSKAVKSVFK